MRTATTVSISPLSRRISAGWPLTCAGCNDPVAVILPSPIASRRATLSAPTMGRRTACLTPPPSPRRTTSGARDVEQALQIARLDRAPERLERVSGLGCRKRSRAVGAPLRGPVPGGRSGGPQPDSCRRLQRSRPTPDRTPLAACSGPPARWFYGAAGVQLCGGHRRHWPTDDRPGSNRTDGNPASSSLSPPAAGRFARPAASPPPDTPARR